MDQSSLSQLSGQRYESAIIALLACSLSHNSNVKDYVIYSNAKCDGKFDGVVVRMQLENPNEHYVCIVQVCETLETLNLNHIIDILSDTNAIYRRNKPDNIRFSIFCSNSINTPMNLNRDNYTLNLTPVQRSEEDEINKILFPFNDKGWKYVCQCINYKYFLDECYLHLNQPDYDEIVRFLTDTYEITRTSHMITYVQNYFNENFLHQQGLTKDIFDMELQKMRLYDSIIFSNKFFKHTNKPGVLILNRIMLKQYVTVIDDGEDADIGSFLTSCLIEAACHLLDIDLDWSIFKADEPLNSNIKATFCKYSKTKSCRYWISSPDTLKDLLIELWKYGDLPLLIKSNVNLSFFKKYHHLRRSYILMDNLEVRLQQISGSKMEIFSHVSNIATPELQNALLEVIQVSLQGRKPTTLKTLIDGDRNLMEQLTCTDIIQMMKGELRQTDNDDDNSARHRIFIPTMGQVILPQEKNYTPVYVRKATITVSSLNSDKGQIYLVSGSDFTAPLKLPLIQIDVNNFIPETSCYVKVQQGKRQIYWNKLIATKRPVFEVMIKSKQLELLRYMHCNSLNDHITFEGERLSEVELLQAIRNNTNAITIITGQKDTDRTSLFQSLCNIDNSQNYILFYDLKQLETYLGQNEIGCGPVEFIFKECHKTSNKHNSFLLELCKRKKLLIFLDSFNEITNDYKKEILIFIENIIPSGAQIIIGSTPDTCDELTKQFNATIFKIEPQITDYSQCYTSKIDIARPQDRDYLHYATKMKDVSSVRQLLNHGFHVNLADEYQRTPLHYAAYEKCINICSLLLDRYDTEVNYEDIDGKIPLNYAVERGALDIANLLLKNKAKVNHKDKSGKSLLHYAVQTNNIDIMRLLLTEKANVNIQDEDGKTPLHYSAENGDINFLKLLLQYGADDNLKNRNGKTPYDCADKKTKALLDNLLNDDDDDDDDDDDVDETIKTPLQYLKKRKCVDTKSEIENIVNVNYQDEDDNTLLHYAVQNANLYLVYLLLQKGAEVNMQNRCRKTPIHYAVEGANVDIVTLLLEGGTDANIGDIYQKTPLHYATEKGNVSYIKLLLQKGANINLQCMFGRSALHYATEGTNENSLKFLLEKGAAVNLQDQDHETALHYAVKKNNINFVKILLDKGANFNIQNKYKLTSLQSAIKNKFVDIYQLLLDKNADINLQDEDNKTALQYAVELRNTDLTKRLLAKDAARDVEDIDGKGPLHYAVESKCVEIVDILLKAGANVTIKDKHCKTPLHYATQRNDIDMVKCLLQHGADVKEDKSYLYYAIMAKNVDIVTILQSKGAYINSKDENNKTPLHYATEAKAKEIIKILIKLKADVNAQDQVDKTPLHYAVEHTCADIVKILLDENASALIKDKYSQTPLHYAAKGHSKHIVELLLEHKADVKALDSESKGCLHYAVEAKNLNIVTTLLTKDANINKKDKKGKTPLHYATEKCIPDIVRVLLEKGAGINLQDVYFKSPLHYAAKNRNRDIIQYFLTIKPKLDYCGEETDACQLANSVNVNLEDGSGKTALHYAAKEGDNDIVKLLLAQEGVTVDVQDEDRKTALHYAVEANAESVVSLLLNMSAETNLPDGHGRTPLHYAVNENAKLIVQCLLNSYADPNIPDENLKTPLHLAVEGNYIDIVNLLLKHSEIDISLKDKFDRTPFEYAKDRRNYAVIELLDTHKEIVKYQKDSSAKLFKKKRRLLSFSSLPELDTYENLETQYKTTNSTEKLINPLSGSKVLMIHLDSLPNAPLFSTYNGEFENSSKSENSEEISNTSCSDLTTTDTDEEFSHRYATRKDNGIFQHLLKLQPSIDVQDTYGKTPLHYAVEENNSDKVKRLLNCSVDVNAKDRKLKTVLHYAAIANAPKIVQLLLQNNIEVNTQDTHSKTPLHYAIESEAAEIVKIFIDGGADVDIKDKSGAAPLHYAVKQQSAEIIKMLLQAKGNPNIQDFDSNTPLHNAATTKNFVIVKLLLEKGADANIHNKDFRTPLHHATATGMSNIVHVLLRNGANVNCQDIQQNTALHYAIKNKDEVIAQYLLTVKPDAKIHVCSIDIDLQDDSLKTTLHLAVNNACCNIVELLLQKQAKVDVLDEKLRTALHYAAKAKNTYLVQLLLSRGANVNVGDRNCKTPLHYAAAANCNYIVKLLMQQSAAVNVHDKYRKSPLHYAVEANANYIVKLLISGGAEVNVQDKSHSTPLHYAVKANNDYLVQLLLKSKANINLKDKWGKTPIHYAAREKENSRFVGLVELGTHTHLNRFVDDSDDESSIEIDDNLINFIQNISNTKPTTENNEIVSQMKGFKTNIDPLRRLQGHTKNVTRKVPQLPDLVKIDGDVLQSQPRQLPENTEDPRKILEIVKAFYKSRRPEMWQKLSENMKMDSLIDNSYQKKNGLSEYELYE